MKKQAQKGLDILFQVTQLVTSGVVLEPRSLAPVPMVLTSMFALQLRRNRNPSSYKKHLNLSVNQRSADESTKAKSPHAHELKNILEVW